MKREGTALMVVDMQNDILDENGKAAALGVWKHARKTKAIENTKKAIENARKAGVPIVYIQTFFIHELLPDIGLPRSLKESEAFKRGTHGAEIVDELSPQPQDYIVEKHSMNAFYNTELEDILKALRCDTLIFTGVATNFCVETTIRSALNRGYNIVVLSDCVATISEDAQNFAINVIFPMLGEVVTVEKLELQ
jgi:ureidoacrylate peracid hydrolase